MLTLQDIIQAVEDGTFSKEELHDLIAAAVGAITSPESTGCTGDEASCGCGCSDVVPFQNYTQDDAVEDHPTAFIKRIFDETPFVVHMSEDENQHSIHVDEVEARDGVVRFTLNEVTYMMPAGRDSGPDPVVALDLVYRGQTHSGVRFRIVKSGSRKIELGAL
jgi:hypothetical protein